MGRTGSDPLRKRAQRQAASGLRRAAGIARRHGAESDHLLRVGLDGQEPVFPLGSTGGPGASSAQSSKACFRGLRGSVVTRFRRSSRRARLAACRSLKRCLKLATPALLRWPSAMRDTTPARARVQDLLAVPTRSVRLAGRPSAPEPDAHQPAVRVAGEVLGRHGDPRGQSPRVRKRESDLAECGAR